MPYNEISKAATNKYRSNFALIQIRLDKSERDKIAAHAKSHGESMNAFVIRAINNTLKSDQEQDGILDVNIKPGGV